jgi:threonine synthase
MQYIRPFESISITESLATGQHSVYDVARKFPLFPAITDGVAHAQLKDFREPLEVSYDYAKVNVGQFGTIDPSRGIDQWHAVLPPLVREGDLGEGRTSLIEIPALSSWAGLDCPVFVKDESRNPTWSHKDRLNRCTVSAARMADAPGVVVASSGNHGASAAAYCARLHLPCIVLASSTAPTAMQSFLDSYGATVLAVPPHRRWPLLVEIVEKTGFHPVSNTTPESHTGHAYGTEGYKTIAYELYVQLGHKSPGAVVIPTGYGELAYGVWKGFVELAQFGLVDSLPKIIICEPNTHGAHFTAIANRTPAASVKPTGATDAASIAVEIGGHRAVAAVQRSNGAAVTLSDAELLEAQNILAREGIWVELSSASSVAALRKTLLPSNGQSIVCISTSSGFKNYGVGDRPLPTTDGTWNDFIRQAARMGLKLA